MRASTIRLAFLLLALHVCISKKCGFETRSKPWLFGMQTWSLAGCTMLSLKSGSITAADLPSLAAALKTVSSGLETVDLSQNDIGDAGVTVLAEALRTHASIKFLDLSYCSIGDDGAAVLTEALKSNSKIRMLVLRGPPVSSAAQMALDAVVQLEPSSRVKHFRELSSTSRSEDAIEVTASVKRKAPAVGHEEV